MSRILVRRAVRALIACALVASALALTGCRPEVPQLIGMRQADAVRAIEEAGFTLGDVNVVATDQVSIGLIAEQSPVFGTKLKKGSPISVSVNFSNGTDAIVPTVTGLEEQTAVGVAETTGLVPLVTEQYSDVVAEGLCAEQVPAPGAQVQVGDTLVIVMSKGKQPAQGKVPDVKGKSQSDAESAITAAGFTSEVFEVYDSEVAKGKVITQLPDAGTSANKGSKVQIVVSLGTGVGAVTVPSVTGKSEADAKSAIEKAGLKASVIKEYSDSVAKGKVAEQFPTSGSKAAAGSEVLILVSLGTPPSGTVAVPDTIGMDEDAAVTAIEDAGLTAVVKTAASDTVAAGTVGAQFPEGGSQLNPGGEVLIGVSTGAP